MGKVFPYSTIPTKRRRKNYDKKQNLAILTVILVSDKNQQY